MVLETHYGIGATVVASAGTSLSHYLGPILHLGFTGVDLFFVLSGFLLGGILLDNKGASNYFKVFYTRRVCRIFPLYFLIVPFLLALPQAQGVFTTGTASDRPLPSWTYLTFTQNIAMAQEGGWGSGMLLPTWSLAVEEQFYLILPLLVWFVSREKFLYLLMGLISLGTLSRLVTLTLHPHGDFAFFFLLPPRADALFWGVLGAWLVRNQRCRDLLDSHRKILYGALAMLIVGACLAALVAATSPYRSHAADVPATYFPPTYGYTLLSLLYLCTLLIAVTEKHGVISFVTRNQLLGKLGVISYGVYLIHLPVLGLLRWFLSGKVQDELLVNVGALLLTIALASISWIFFEKRIVNWGRSFKYHNTIVA
jgi:peptidoglycan/LPS O-acetylase OafA/YrhL